MYLLLSYTLNAQQQSYKYIQPKFELKAISFNSKENFGVFNDAAEDQQHFLWLTATNGICAFDGKNLILYSNSSKPYPIKPGAASETYGTLSSNNKGIFYIVEKKSGILCFDPQKRKPSDEYKPKEIGQPSFPQLSIGPDNSILAFSVNKINSDFYIYKLENLKPQLIFSGKVSNNRFNLQFFLCYAMGSHWFVNDKQILRISNSGKNIKHYSLPDVDNGAVNVYADSGHLFFMGEKNNDIYAYNPLTDKIELYARLPRPISLSLSSSQFAIKGENIYLADNASFFIINKTDHSIQDLSPDIKALSLKTSVSFEESNIAKILLTSVNGIFLITKKSICRLQQKLPPTSSFLQQLRINDFRKSVFSFRQLAEDKDHNIYASYYAGLAMKRKGTDHFISYPLSNQGSFKPLATYGLNYWQDHLLWNNTMIDLHTRKYIFMNGTGHGGHTVQYLGNDTLWYYNWSLKNLYRYDLKNRHLDSFLIDPSFGESSGIIEALNAIVADNSGKNLWLATQRDGIALITKQGVLLKKYGFDALGLNEVDRTSVNALLLRAEGLWFGCDKGLGLLHTETGKIDMYRIPQLDDNGYFKNRTIFSMIADEKNNFYLGSNAGLIYFDAKARIFYHLPENHPLTKVEFNRASALRTSDGRYYFGSTNGLYSFKASELQFEKPSNATWPIKVNNITIFNSDKKKYRYLGSYSDTALSLSLAENSFDIDFSVPEFQKKVYYSYRVLGQKENWTECGSEHIISLYNLQHGNYTLEIKASTDPSDYSSARYRLYLNIGQVWYKQPWIIIVFFLATLALVVLLTRYRFNEKLKKQMELANLRTRISTDLHDDVGSVLSGLAMQSEMLTYMAGGELKESLKEISEMSRDAMDSMRDIVWAMDNRKDKYENLIDRMRSFAEKACSVKGLTLDFVVKDINTGKFIDPDKRQTIYLIFKEAITNIGKHSDGKHVAVSMIQHVEYLQLLVRDDGSEKQSSCSDGLGLSNMKIRAEKIGGMLSVRYEQGFVVDLKIGMPKVYSDC